MKQQYLEYTSKYKWTHLDIHVSMQAIVEDIWHMSMQSLERLPLFASGILVAPQPKTAAHTKKGSCFTKAQLAKMSRDVTRV